MSSSAFSWVEVPAVPGRSCLLPCPPSQCQPCQPENQTPGSIDSLNGVRRMGILCEDASPLVLLMVVPQQPVVVFESLTRACGIQRLVNDVGWMVLCFCVRYEVVRVISHCGGDS
jgi:hypothetical protein